MVFRTLPVRSWARTPTRRNRFALAVGAAIAAMLGGPLWAVNAAENLPLMAYVGTFSSPLQDMLPTQVDLPPGNGRGIHLFRVARDSGALEPAGVVEMGTSPSCLTANHAGTRLYSANETDRVGQPSQGTISAFEVDRSSGQLRLIGSVPSGGAGPTYVSLHPSEKFLFAANYFGGSVSVIPIATDGSLGPATDVRTDVGTIGATRAEHAPPGSFAISGHDRTHAHMIQSDSTGRFVMHIDLGLDRIYMWRFDAVHGKLVANSPPYVTLPSGDGPRHFYFHPNGRWFYSIQEEGSNVVLFDFDNRSGQLTARQTISTLPQGFAGSNFCSEILGTSDGRFVFAGNRLHDSIATFSVGEEGQLSWVGEQWTRGNYPRSFAFSPMDKFLYCCNQRADHVTTFRIQKETGDLEFTGQYTPVGNPSMILFLELDRTPDAATSK